MMSRSMSVSRSLSRSVSGSLFQRDKSQQSKHSSSSTDTIIAAPVGDKHEKSQSRSKSFNPEAMESIDYIETNEVDGVNDSPASCSPVR